MRDALPWILVFLGLFTGACIVYIAWELSSERYAGKPTDDADPGDDAG
jgi:threonine/homoserine/homoserine lactone efflux protein